MPPRTDWAETVAPDEAERFERYATELAALARARDARRGAGPARGFHVKPHLGAQATLTVRADLPAPYRVGIFANAGTWDAWVRFSNGSVQHQKDREPDIRGLAVKVVGVPGEKLIPGMTDAATQDFLAIHAPTVPFRDTDEFVRFVLAARDPLWLLPRVLWAFGPGGAYRLLAGFLTTFGRKPGSLATERYWTPAPVRWGAHAAKYRFCPVDAAPAPAPGRGADYLADELVGRLAAGPLAWDLEVQLYADPERTPIEDASRVWPEDLAPFEPVARLTLPAQDLRSTAGAAAAAYVERLSFDPWHAPVEFRPLGNVMRARGPAYRESTIARGALPEPARMVDPLTEVP